MYICLFQVQTVYWVTNLRVGLGLRGLMTLDLSKNIQCHV